MRNYFISAGSAFLKHDLIKGSAIIFTGSMVVNVLNYGFHLITGRMLGPEQYAVLASLISLSYVINFPSTLLTTVVTNKVAALYAKKDMPGIQGFLQVIGKNLVILTGLVIIGFWIFQRHIASFLNIHDPNLVLLLGLGFAVSLISTVPLAAFQGLLKFTAYSVMQALFSLLRTGTAVIAIWFSYGVPGVLTGILGSAIVLTFGSFALLRRYLPGKARPMPFVAHAYTSKIWVMAALFGKGLLINIDVLLVKHFFEAHDAGLYAALATLGKIVLFFASSISTVLLPIASKKHAEGKSTASELLLAQGMIIFLSTGILGVYIAAPKLVIGMLYGNAYFDVAPYLWMIGLYFMFYNLTYTYVNYFISGHHTRILLAPLFAAALQIGGILVYHGSFGEVLTVMNITGAILMAIFTIYYIHYARKT